LLKKKIERIDARFDIDIVPFQKSEVSDELLKLEENIKVSRDKQKAYKAEYLDLLRTDFVEVVNAYLITSKNPKQRSRLQETFGTGLLNKNFVANFVSVNPVAVAYKDKGKIINYIAKLEKVEVDRDLILQMLTTKKQGYLKTFADSKIIFWRHKNYMWLDSRGKMECEIDKAIIRGINKAKQNVKNGKYKNGFAKKILTNIVKRRATKVTNIYTIPILTDTQCLSRLKTLFEMETERKTIKDNKIQIYKIGKCKIELRGRKSQK